MVVFDKEGGFLVGGLYERCDGLRGLGVGCAWVGDMQWVLWGLDR